MRNVMIYTGKIQRRIVSTWIGTDFVQDDVTAAHKQWREVASLTLSHIIKHVALMDEAEADVLARMNFPT